MNCPTCAAWSRVLETRTSGEGFVIRRRHQCANGCKPFHSVQMLEVAHTAACQRHREAWPVRRAKLAARDAGIRRRLAAGHRGKDIAADLGVSPSLVSLVAKGKQ